MGKTRRTEQLMTSLERLHALLEGRPVDRVACYLFGRGFSSKMVGYSLTSIYDDPEKSFFSQLWTAEMFGTEDIPRFAYASYPALEFGGEIKFPTSQYAQAPSITRYPVESEADIDKLKLPDVKTAGLLPKVMVFSRLAEKSGLPVFVQGGSPLSRAANLCGVDMLCRWMVKKPELVHRLLRLVTDFTLSVVKHWADTFGAERLIVMDGATTDSNQLISPRHFEKFSLPYLVEQHQKSLDIGVKHMLCHICGDHNKNLPLWKDVPMGSLGIVSLGHEVDLNTAVKTFGDKCIVAGNIEPVIIQTGTPRQVYELARQCIEKAKHSPCGYLLMPGCELPPLAPPYNVYSMIKALDDFGWYS